MTTPASGLAASLLVMNTGYKSPHVVVSRSRRSALAWPGIACIDWSWEMLKLRKLDKILGGPVGLSAGHTPSWQLSSGCSLQDTRIPYFHWNFCQAQLTALLHRLHVLAVKRASGRIHRSGNRGRQAAQV